MSWNETIPETASPESKEQVLEVFVSATDAETLKQVSPSENSPMLTNIAFFEWPSSTFPDESLIEEDKEQERSIWADLSVESLKSRLSEDP